MIYRSTVIKGLEYDICDDILDISLDGKSRRHQMNRFDKLLNLVLDDDMAREMTALYAAYHYLLATRGRQLTLDDKGELAKLLGISYGDLQKKRQAGELKL